MTEIQAMLQEYEDLFPNISSELKGIKGDLGEVKIEMKLDTKPVKHGSYLLNPRVKEKVKREIDRIPAAELIFPVDEAKCISLIFI
jgi:hypothetical protein